MNIFGRNKAREARTLGVFDIGSASVGGAIVQYNQDGRPEILRSTRVNLVVPEQGDVNRLLSTLMRAISDVATQLMVAGGLMPEEIIVTTSAPWVASQTRLLQVHKPTPFVFTKKIADELIAREMRRFEEGRIKEWAEYVDDHMLLEHKTMRVRLNGYFTNEPLGKRVTSAELASFMSIMESDLHQRITQHIGRIFHAPVSIHSFLFASYVTIKQSFHNQDDVLIIDLGGEITELGIVRNEILLQSVSFPYGRNHVLRSLADTLNISTQEALSLLRMYNSGALSEQRLYEVAPAIEQAGTIWLEHLKTVLNNIAQTSLIPSVVFLHADEEAMPYFKKRIEEEDTHQYVSSHRPFSVIPMNLQSLSGYLLDHEIKHDPFLAVGALFASTLVDRRNNDDELTVF